MSAAAIAAIITGAGAAVSILTAAFISGYRWGQVKTELAVMKRQLDLSATKEELTSVRENVAEIKGMFRLTLKDGTAS